MTYYYFYFCKIILNFNYHNVYLEFECNHGKSMSLPPRPLLHAQDMVQTHPQKTKLTAKEPPHRPTSKKKEGPAH